MKSIIRASKVVLATLKIPEPIEALYFGDGILLSKYSILTIEKGN